MNSDIPNALYSYILQHIDPEGDYLHRLWRAANIHTVHGHMASGHLQGRLLKMLVMMLRPRYILEVGTFSGYSAICMAEGLKELSEAEGVKVCGDGLSDCVSDDGNHKSQSPILKSQSSNLKPQSSNLKSQSSNLKSQSSNLTPHTLFTFEINDEMEDFTRPWIDGSGLAEYIDFRIGDAITEAPRLGVMFDMAFIDGDKRTYVETYDAVLPLMNEGGIVVADNTLWDGHVVDPAYDHDHQTMGIRRFNDHVAADKRVEKVILPIRDGLTIIRKR